MTDRASIVVPVHNKQATIEPVLRALAGQSASRETFEVIVVDDHSSEDCAGLLRRLTECLGFRLAVLRGGVPSASAARNAGLKMATGERVLLLDADVVLSDNAVAALVDDHAAETEAVWVETYGSSIADSIWELHGPTPRGGIENRAWSEWEYLADPRAALAAGEQRRFDHLRAPWVFFWTTAVWISRRLLLDLGGFDTGLSGKGSEDIELGYRLHHHGVRFRLARGPKGLHLPHSRDRDHQERWDRVHERRVLACHPDPAVEMLCAFDAGNANKALDALGDLRPAWGREPPPPRGRVAVLDGAGSTPIYIGPWIHSAVIAALPTDARMIRRDPLIGFCLPDRDESFDAALLPDMRGFLPEAAVCRLLQEASRVARRVFAVRWSRPIPVENPLPERIWREFDRPYWERSQRISRSYYDWRADLAERVPTAEPGCMLDVLQVRPSSSGSALAVHGGKS
jgi:glycosyltransferase involved in cell wall biosynthesis